MLVFFSQQQISFPLSSQWFLIPPFSAAILVLSAVWVCCFKQEFSNPMRLFSPVPLKIALPRAVCSKFPFHWKLMFNSFRSWEWSQRCCKYPALSSWSPLLSGWLTPLFKHVSSSVFLDIFFPLWSKTTFRWIIEISHTKFFLCCPLCCHEWWRLQHWQLPL